MSPATTVPPEAIRRLNRRIAELPRRARGRLSRQRGLMRQFELPKDLRYRTLKGIYTAGGNQVKNVNKDVVFRMRQELMRSESRGESTRRTAQRLSAEVGLDQGVFKDVKTRARLIAVTERRDARQAALIDLSRQHKFPEGIWITMEDGKVCRRCGPRHGWVYTWEDWAGLKTSMHPRDRCHIYPYSKKAPAPRRPLSRGVDTAVLPHAYNEYQPGVPVRKYYLKRFKGNKIRADRAFFERIDETNRLGKQLSSGELRSLNTTQFRDLTRDFRRCLDLKGVLD